MGQETLHETPESKRQNKLDSAIGLIRNPYTLALIAAGSTAFAVAYIHHWNKNRKSKNENNVLPQSEDPIDGVLPPQSSNDTRLVIEESNRSYSIRNALSQPMKETDRAVWRELLGTLEGRVSHYWQNRGEPKRIARELIEISHDIPDLLKKVISFRNNFFLVADELPAILANKKMIRKQQEVARYVNKHISELVYKQGFHMREAGYHDIVAINNRLSQMYPDIRLREMLLYGDKLVLVDAHDMPVACIDYVPVCNSGSLLDNNPINTARDIVSHQGIEDKCNGMYFRVIPLVTLDSNSKKYQLMILGARMGALEYAREHGYRTVFEPVTSSVALKKAVETRNISDYKKIWLESEDDIPHDFDRLSAQLFGFEASRSIDFFSTEASADIPAILPVIDREDKKIVVIPATVFVYKV